MADIIRKQGWTLMLTIGMVDTRPALEGEEVEDFRGDRMTIVGGQPPLHSASTGRVWVQEGGHEREYFPSVVGARWVRDQVPA